MATGNLGHFLQRVARGMVARTLGDQSDAQLVERALAGQAEAAFEALVHRHGPMVYRVCWRVLQQEQDCEDVFQATFLLLAQKLHTVRQHASLASWLHGVAHRVALKARARAATRRRHETQAPTPARPPDNATWIELRSVLDAELAGMPDRWRLPLLLCYLEGRTQEEAAGQLGWSKNTLRRRLEEARVALGRRLARRGVWPAALSAALLSDCVAPAAIPPKLVSATVEAVGGLIRSTLAVPAELAALMAGGVTVPLYKTRLALVMFLAMSAIATTAGIAAQRDPSDPAGPRVAALVPIPDGIEPDSTPATKQEITPAGLAGRWQLKLPAGFTHEVVIRPLGENQVALEKAVRFSGVYELRGDRLVLIQAAVPPEHGYEWAVRAGGDIALVAQPPPARTGQNYLGAKMTRLKSP